MGQASRRDNFPVVDVRQQQPAGRVRFEYRSLLVSRLAELDQFGEEGWELVSVISSPADEAVYYFKRRKQ